MRRGAKAQATISGINGQYGQLLGGPTATAVQACPARTCGFRNSDDRSDYPVGPEPRTTWPMSGLPSPAHYSALR